MNNNPATKVYLKKRLTLEKLEYYFEGMMVDQNESLSQSELDELASAIRSMISGKDAEAIIEKAQRLVVESGEPLDT